MSSQSQFRLNRREAKVMGVCAGIADHFDVDVTLVRVGLVVAILVGTPFVLLGYFAVGLIAKDGRPERQERREHRERAEHQEETPRPRRSSEDMAAARQRLRDLDARMQKLEDEVVTTNSTLAREIDSLR